MFNSSLVSTVCMNFVFLLMVVAIVIRNGVCFSVYLELSFICKYALKFVLIDLRLTPHIHQSIVPCIYMIIIDFFLLVKEI